MARKKRSGARKSGGAKGGKPAILSLTAKRRPAKTRVGKITSKKGGKISRKTASKGKVKGRTY